jgi:putrescine aminotransferase
MTVPKGLTAGYAPMGAFLLSDEIHSTIRDGLADGVRYGHGFTYPGHPVAAAIGLEVLRLCTEGGVLANGQQIAPPFAEGLEALSTHPLVGDVRVRGLLAGIELVVDKSLKTKPPPALSIHDHLARIGYARGLIFRAYGDDTIGLAPPLCMTLTETELLLSRLRSTLDEVLAIPEIRHALG